MVSPSLVSRYISNKVWNATIKIPELKTTLPATSSLFDVDQVVAMVTDMFQQHKGGLLVVTGAGRQGFNAMINHAIIVNAHFPIE